MQALAFTSDDLKANRAGQLSESQRARLCFVYRSLTTSKQVIWIAVGFVGVHSLLWFGLSFVSRNFDVGTIKAILVEALVFAAFVLWVRHRERAAQRPDPEESRVIAIEGDVKCGSQPVPRSLMQLFYVEVSGARFIVSEQVARAFEHGRRYRVYTACLEATTRIVSAEPVTPVFAA